MADNGDLKSLGSEGPCGFKSRLRHQMLYKMRECIMLARCGVCCLKDCRAYETDCKGCNDLAGCVAWAPYYGRER
jgi:hypothetical protein